MKDVVDMNTDLAVDELDRRIDRLKSGMEPEELQVETTTDTEEDDQRYIKEFLSFEETWNEAAEFSKDDSVEFTLNESPEITFSFACDEIQDENKTQEDEAHTPVSDDDYKAMCASPVDAAHSGRKGEETSGNSDIGSPLESCMGSASSELDAEDEASQDNFDRLELSERLDAMDDLGDNKRFWNRKRRQSSLFKSPTAHTRPPRRIPEEKSHLSCPLGGP